MQSIQSRTLNLVLAGGRGERLQPLTHQKPKPLVSFGGIYRIIDFTLSNCVNSQLSKICILTQYRHDAMKSYIREGWNRFSGKVSKDGDCPVCLPPSRERPYRGTADAVFQNINLLRRDKPDFVLILSGDHVYHMDYTDLIRRHADTGADVTIAAIKQPIQTAYQFGVLETDGRLRVVGFQESR